MLRNDGHPNLLGCFALSMELTSQTRFVDADVAGCGVSSPEAIEQAAMTYTLAIAVTWLLREDAWDFLGDRISFLDFRVFEL